jgi:molybdenum cofactor guanylyltransferase
VILAGGQATRYGGAAKGLVHVGGKRVIDRISDALVGVTDALLLIANDPAGALWLPGVRTEKDVRVGCGSLGGIHAALVHAGGDVLVVAWDMPFVSAGLLSALRSSGSDADVAVPESDSRRGVEPLCAFYGAGCVAPIERRLDEGDFRVVGFYDDVRVARLGAETVRRFGDPELLFLNINAPEDLELAERHVSSTDGGRRRQKA